MRKLPKIKRRKLIQPARLMRLTMLMDDMSYRLNRLPHWARQYIHDLESRDPAGDTQTIADLREQVRALSLRVQELEREKGS